MSRFEELSTKFSPHEIQMYRHHFETFDLNKDGVISAIELEKVATQLGYRLSRRDIDDIMRTNDMDRNGILTFDEFLFAMPGNNNISKEHHKMAEIRRKFQEYDRDGNGVVTIPEAHAILRRELAFTPKQTVELVKRYDKNGDGNLSYEEFVQFYHNVRTKACQIKEMFHEFDRDKSGAVSLEEAQFMLRKLDISDEEVETLVAIHDKNKDGQLQYDEFVSFLLHS